MPAPRRILIVDDEPNVRLVFRTTLESAGYAPEVAEDGQAALDRLAAEPAELVLLDLRMPNVDGLELLRRLREAGEDVPVVLVTAHGSIPDAVAAMKLGAIDFLAKPITPAALRVAVADVFARRPGPGTGPSANPPADPGPPASPFAGHLREAKAAINRRAFDEAELLLRQASGLEPRSAEAHNLLGVIHELRGRHDESYAAYRAALKADRDYAPAQRNMQRYYERFTFGRSDIAVDTGPPPR